MAVLFAILGLFGNPLLIFIALFVWMGAAQEASMVQMRSALAGIPVSRVMITRFVALHPDDPVSRVGEHILAGFQQDFPVVEDGKLVGVVMRKDLAAALAAYDPTAHVRDIMHREFVTTDPREMLYVAFGRLQECNCRTLPVVENGVVKGLLTADNVAEVLMLQESLRNSTVGAGSSYQAAAEFGRAPSQPGTRA
jgi:predicted transcriptional regulator